MRYAEITDTTVTNLVICDDQEYADEQGWITLDDDSPVDIGWTYKRRTFSEPEPPETDLGAAASTLVQIDPDELLAAMNQLDAATTVKGVKNAVAAIVASMTPAT